MKISKRIFLTLGNLIIGILSVYAYLFFWMMFSLGGSLQILTLEGTVTLLFLLVSFLYLIFFMLKGDQKSNWWYSLSIAIVAIVIFIAI